MPKVAVIILTYNGLKYLPNLLGSLFDFLPQTLEEEVIVVDNHSSDGTVPWLRENYASVAILEQSANLGFAAGNNVGLRYALERNFDYLLLLNQDTIVTSGYLEQLVGELEKNPRAAAVQPKLMLYPLTDLVNSLGNVIHYLGFGYTYGNKTRIHDPRPSRRGGQSRKPTNEINYCSGAACLLRASALKKAGLFDDQLFIYHEDLDLGWRFSLLGYRNLICPEAVVYHQYEFSRSIRKYYYMERNRFIVLLKNYHWLTILVILPALVIMEVGLLFFSFGNGWRREKLEGYAYFLKPSSWRAIFVKRAAIQKIRQFKDREIVRSFSGKIEHQEVDNPVVRAINPFFDAYWQVVKNLIFW